MVRGKTGLRTKAGKRTGASTRVRLWLAVFVAAILVCGQTVLVAWGPGHVLDQTAKAFVVAHQTAHDLGLPKETLNASLDWMSSIVEAMGARTPPSPLRNQALASLHTTRAEHFSQSQRHESSLAAWQASLDILEGALAADPALEGMLVQSAAGIARSQAELGNTSQAIRAWKTVIQKLEAFSSHNLAAQSTYADAQFALGVLYKKEGQHDLAISHLTHAADLSLQVDPADPGALAPWLRSLDARIAMSEIQEAGGRVVEASHLYEELALEIEALSRKFPRETGTPARAYRVAISLGDLRLGEGKIFQALSHFSTATEALKRSLAENGLAPDRRHAVALNRVGDARFALGDNDGALVAYMEGFEISRRLAASAPEEEKAQQDLAISWARLGDVYYAKSNFAIALEAWEKDLSITRGLLRTSPRDPERLYDVLLSFDSVAVARIAIGDEAGALEVRLSGLEELAANMPDCGQADQLMDYIDALRLSALRETARGTPVRTLARTAVVYQYALDPIIARTREAAESSSGWRELLTSLQDEKSDNDRPDAHIENAVYKQQYIANISQSHGSHCMTSTQTVSLGKGQRKER